MSLHFKIHCTKSLISRNGGSRKSQIILKRDRPPYFNFKMFKMADKMCGLGCGPKTKNTSGLCCDVSAVGCLWLSDHRLLYRWRWVTESHTYVPLWLPTYVRYDLCHTYPFTHDRVYSVLPRLDLANNYKKKHDCLIKKSKKQVYTF